MARVARLKLTPGLLGSEIEVDGQWIPHVRTIRLDAEPLHLPHLTLDFLLRDVEVDGVMQVTVPDETRQALMALGWTPPADDDGEPGQVEPEPELWNPYRERAALVAHLATLFPAAIAYSDPDEPDWPVIYITTPHGQLSWHISPDDLDLFQHVPTLGVDEGPVWDGHTTAEKYERLAALVRDLMTP